MSEEPNVLAEIMFPSVFEDGRRACAEGKGNRCAAADGIWDRDIQHCFSEGWWHELNHNKEAFDLQMKRLAATEGKE